MNSQNERGFALVLALFLVSALSVLAGSLMFLSQTETYSSMNYKLMSQARYGAEAGVEKAANFLYDINKYSKPGMSGSDLLTAYNYTTGVSPVTLVSNGQPVVLSTVAGQSNYPVSSVVTAFANAAQGSLTVDNTTVAYTASARLLSMQTFDPYGGAPGGTTPGVVQTWEITSDGVLTGSKKATVEVVAIGEQPVWAANSYAAFATANICGALYFNGNVTTNSYDSTGLGNGNPTFTSSGGNVGTNGNLQILGSVDVQGNLYTPRTGVGTCTANAVDALSSTGNAQVDGSVVQLPSAVRYPPPALPNPMPPTNNVPITGLTATTCADLGFNTPPNQASWCTTSGNGSNQKITVDSGGLPITLPNVSLGSQITLEIMGHSPAQQVNINSLDLTGGGTLAVNATAQNQSVLINLAGKNSDGTDMATVMDFGGNSGGQFANDSACTGCSHFDASMLQFLYAGPGLMKFKGTTAAAATMYAPNAALNLTGTADFYGSMLGMTVQNSGNANIHYDRRLSRDFYVEGSEMLGSFTWKRF